MYRRTSWIDCADLTARNDIDRVGEGLQLVVLDVPAELLDFQLADSVLLLLLLQDLLQALDSLISVGDQSIHLSSLCPVLVLQLQAPLLKRLLVVQQPLDLPLVLLLLGALGPTVDVADLLDSPDLVLEDLVLLLDRLDLLLEVLSRLLVTQLLLA